MKPTFWLSAVAGAVALGTFSIAAQAAPLGSAATGANAGSGAGSLVQDVARRCWRHRGHLHCRGDDRHYYRDPGYSYGSSYGPGFGFYFGGGDRDRWDDGRRHHRHRH